MQRWQQKEVTIKVARIHTWFLNPDEKQSKFKDTYWSKFDYNFSCTVSGKFEATY